MFIKDKNKVASRVSSNQRAGIHFGKLLWESNKKKFSFREVESIFLKIAVIQEDRQLSVINNNYFFNHNLIFLPLTFRSLTISSFLLCIYSIRCLQYDLIITDVF